MKFDPQDADVMARTIYGEARGESFLGQVAVAWVIRNRATHPGWWGKTVVEVCRRPHQFSCWDATDPNRQKLLDATISDPVYARAYGIALLVLTGDLHDPTDGATHYYATSIDAPEWTRRLMERVTIGNHRFYA